MPSGPLRIEASLAFDDLHRRRIGLLPGDHPLRNLEQDDCLRLVQFQVVHDADVDGDQDQARIVRAVGLRTTTILDDACVAGRATRRRRLLQESVIVRSEDDTRQIPARMRPATNAPRPSPTVSTISRDSCGEILEQYGPEEILRVRKGLL